MHYPTYVFLQKNRNMRKYFFLLLLIPVGAYTQTVSYISDPGGRIRPHNVDFTHLLLELSIDPYQGQVAGVAHYTFKPKQQLVDSVFLDAPGILFNAVTLDAQASRFKRDSAGVTIYFNPALQWDTEHTLQIDYTSTPAKDCILSDGMWSPLRQQMIPTGYATRFGRRAREPTTGSGSRGTTTWMIN